MANIIANERELIVEDARIIWRNFEGRPGRYNTEGTRRVSLVIDNEEDAKMISDLGWNVKSSDPRDPEDLPLYYIEIKVEYGKGKPPRCYSVTRNNTTLLDADTVGMLDNASLTSVDLVVSAYDWVMDSGKSGKSAYLQSLYATLEEDYFSSKYGL